MAVEVDGSNTSWTTSEEGISIYFVVFSSLLALVLVLSKFLHDCPKLASYLPEAGMILLVGMLIGGLINLLVNDDQPVGDDDSVDADLAQSLLSFSPKVFFVALLPPIIFNSGYHIRRDLFFLHITPICLFAYLGTLISAVSIALILQLVVHLGLTGSFQPRFTELLTFGALISATDPVSTLAVFQSKRVDPHLFYLVFGEAVLNDAVGLVLFNSFAKFVERDNGAGKVIMGVIAFVVDFVVSFAGSLCLGILFGVGAAYLLKKVDMRETTLLELSLYILIMYAPFLLAEIMHLSGIVTILFTGMAARRYCVPNLSKTTDSNSDVFFRLVAHIAETSIFLELGLSVFGLAGGNLHWQFVLWALLACLIGRAFNIYPITFFFNQSLHRSEAELTNDPYIVNVEMKTSDQHFSSADESQEYENVWKPHETLTPVQRRDMTIPWRTSHMLFFSGLRGAVAYACARSFPDTFGHKTPFIVTTMIIVLATVFILGGCTELMLTVLKIPMNVDEDVYMENKARPHILTGFMAGLETKYIRRFVIRDFEKQIVASCSEESAPEGLVAPSDEEAADPQAYQQHIERTDSGNLSTTSEGTKQSLFDYGVH